jgi:hypothetical protein
MTEQNFAVHYYDLQVCKKSRNRNKEILRLISKFPREELILHMIVVTLMILWLRIINQCLEMARRLGRMIENSSAFCSQFFKEIHDEFSEYRIEIDDMELK